MTDEETFYGLPAIMPVPHRPEGSVTPPVSMEEADLERWGGEVTSALDGLLTWSKEMHASIYDSYIPQTDRIENMNMVGETLSERPDAIGSRRFFYHRPNRTLYLDVRYGGSDFWDIVFSTDAAIVVLDTTNFDNILGPLDADLQHAMDTLDDHTHDAVEIPTDTTNFNNKLGVLDDEVQHALDTLDNHAHDGDEIALDTTLFDGILSGTEDTSQKAFDVLDDITITYKQLVPLDTYIDLKARQTEWNLHGGIHSLVVADTLDSITPIIFTAGRGKLFISVNAGSDVSGSITVTGTTVDRDDGTQTPADTDVLTVDAVTTDASDVDANGNIRHSFTGGYITSKWFTGSITLSTTDLDLSDVDVYQVAFEQCNDEPNCEILTMDFAGVPTNASAYLDVYAYLLEVTGDKADITRIVDGAIPASEISANKWYRGRRGQMAATFDGTTDGFWLDFFPGPLNQDYWEDINIKVWIEVTKTAVIS